MVTRTTIKNGVALTVILLLLLLPHLISWPLPFFYVLPMTLLVGFTIRRNKETFKQLGFDLKLLNLAVVAWGIAAGTALYVVLEYAIWPVLQSLFPFAPANLGDFAALKNNSGFYLFLIAMSWLVGGLYEEMIFRGFIFTRLEKWFPKKKYVAMTIGLCTLAFAAYHLQLGTVGVINAFLAGIAYHGLLLWPKRNIWRAVVAHAVYDNIAITHIYHGN